MLKFMLKRQGSISIFLVIILLPMLCIGSIMVDMSRIKLAYSVAESAGSLTLNTGLTCYDNVLKEMYGLMASSQNYDELMGNLEDYYAKTISASGVSNDITQNYVDRIMNQLTGIGISGDATDLLQMEVVDFKEIQREEASLVNPALLKSQIVNFMKYRGPIQFGLGFLDSLKSFSTIGEQLEVIEAKQDYYEARQTVVENCEDAWRNIYAYNNLGLTEEYFTKAYDELNNYKIKYQFVNRNIVYDFYDAKNNFSGDTHTYAVDYGGSFDFYWKGKKESVSVTGANEMSGFVSSMNSARTSFNEAMNSDISKQMCLGETSDVYAIKQIIYYQKFNDDAKGYAKNAHNLYIAYNKFIAAKEALIEYIKAKEEELIRTQEDLEDTKSSLDSAEDELSSLQSELSGAKDAEEKQSISSQIQSVRSSISSYESQISSLENRIRDLNKDILEKKEWLNKTYDGKSLDAWESEYTRYYLDSSTMKAFSKLTHGMKSVIDGSSQLSYMMTKKTFTNKKQLVEGEFSNTVLTEISSYMEDKYKNIENGINYLTNARKNLQFVSSELAASGSLKQKENVWGNKASVNAIAGTSVSEQNLSELDSIQEFINKEDVDELLKHMDGAIDTLTKAKTEFEDYKYGDTLIMEIKKINEAVKSIDKKGFGTQIINVKAKESVLDTLSQTVFQGMYQQPSKVLTHSWLVATDHPELEHMEHSFYAYLKQMFGKVVEEGESYKAKKKEAEQLQSNTEKKLDSYKELKEDGTSNGASDNRFKFSGMGGLPSYEWLDGGLKEKTIEHNEKAMVEYEKADSSGATMDGPSETKRSGSQLKSFFQGITSALKNMGTSLRDNVFIAGYIMNMFSYDTFENEKIWEAKGFSTQLIDNNVDRKNVVVNGKSYATACYNAEGKFDVSGIKGLDTSALGASDLKTLTNVAISPQNNAAYLSEVEYIVYGENDSSKAYGTIYVIRAGFNTIYAFSDTAISSMAQGIATAIFGTPPLTFLVPIAKAAIIIGVALAESALDIACLKAGMAIPIYKTKETWMLSVDNLINGAVDLAKDYASEKLQDTAASMINFSTSKINEWLDMTDAQLKKMVEEGGKELEDFQNAITDSITKAVEQYIGTAVDQLITLCEHSKTIINNGKPLTVKERCSYVEEKLRDWINKDSSDKISVMYKAKAMAVDILIERIEEVIQELEKLEFGVFEPISDKIDEVEAKIVNSKDALIINYNAYINNLIILLNNKIFDTEDIYKYIDSVAESTKSAVNQGSDALKESVNNSIEQLLGTNGATNASFVNTNVTASLYSFQYSDYLQLFLIIGLLINQEIVLLRTADVIQTNTGLVKYGIDQLGAASEVYRLKDAYTYIELEATIEVKPTFLKLPFVWENVSEDLKKNNNWYTIRYRGVQGY